MDYVLPRTLCRSFMGAWIEIMSASALTTSGPSRSFMGAWIEIYPAHISPPGYLRRSFMGAWIEIKVVAYCEVFVRVAP